MNPEAASSSVTGAESGNPRPAHESVLLPCPAHRLVSVDALRGFDMFWIIGGAGILVGWGKVIQQPLFDKFLKQFTHVPWEGLHFEDLILYCRLADSLLDVSQETIHQNLELLLRPTAPLRVS